MISFLLFICLMWFSIFVMYVRNEQVFKEKIRVLGVCAERAQKVVDANPEADWKAEFAPIERYSYDEMVYKFWIPVKKFYQDIN